MESLKYNEDSEKGRKINLPAPAPVSRVLSKLGQDINRARRRRSLTQQEVANRIGASLNTVKRLEHGDPRIPVHFLARVLFLFGELDRLGKLLDSGLDDIGLTLMDERLPKRVRPSKKRETAF